MTMQIPPEHPSELHAQYASSSRRHVVSVREVIQRVREQFQIVNARRAEHKIGTQGVLDVMQYVREETDIEPNICADGAIRARVVYDTSTGEVVEAKEAGI
jgi:hypothetical protein